MTHRLFLIALALVWTAPAARSCIIDPAKITAATIGEGEVPAIVRTRTVGVRKASAEGEERRVSRNVEGHGHVSGSLFASCPSRGTGFRSGSVHLSGTIQVSNSDGASGSAHVSGFIHMSGSCFNGSGSVSGSGTVSGSASIYDRSGKYLGTARVSDHFFVHGHGFGGSIHVSEWVSVRGSF